MLPTTASETMSPAERAAYLKGIKRLVLRNSLISVSIYLLFQLSVWWTVNHLPPGRAFVLTPRGLGFLYEFLIFGVALGILSALYSAAALRVRKSLGCCLQSLLLFALIGGFVALQWDMAIAVVQTPTDFVLVKPFPFSARTFSYKDLPGPKIDEAGAMKRLSFTFSPDDGLSPQIKAAWRVDKQTCAIVDELYQAMVQAISNR